jgi:glycerol-3-phosphate cytidylyltransferase
MLYEIKGFTCGAFDLTHAGHYLMFEECRKQCSFLVVGLQTDPSTDRPEKHKPIQSLEERLIQLSACKWIDDIVIYHTEAQLYELLKHEVKPDVRFLGEDHRGKPFTGDDLNIKIIYNSRDHDYSSSSLIERTVKQAREEWIKNK